MQLRRPLIIAGLTSLALFSAAALGAGTAGLLYLNEISAVAPTSFDTSAALQAAHALPDDGPLPTPEPKIAAAVAEGSAIGADAGIEMDADETDGASLWRSRPEIERPQRRASSRASGDTVGAESVQPQAQSQAQGETCSDKIDGVTRHSSTRFSLSRSFVNTYIKDQNTAAQQGRAAWRQNKQKENVGVRVAGLRCAPRAAGLRNNDVIREINGRPMTSTVNAYAAYKDIKSGDRFSIKLKRDGQLMTLQYTVQ